MIMAVKQEEGYIEAQDGATPLNQQVSVSTPKKRKQKGDELDAGQSASKKPASPIKKLPDSAAELTDEFKMLIRMKEDSCPWSEIKQAWLRETGESASTNTLSMRYARLKARLTVVKEEDVPKFIESLRNVESKMETEKWSRVAAELQALGGGKYEGRVLQRKAKELDKQGLLRS